MEVEFFFHCKLVVDLFYHLNKCNERNCYLKYNSTFCDLVLVSLYSTQKINVCLNVKINIHDCVKAEGEQHVVVVAHRKLQEGFS